MEMYKLLIWNCSIIKLEIYVFRAKIFLFLFWGWEIKCCLSGNLYPYPPLFWELWKFWPESHNPALLNSNQFHLLTTFNIAKPVLYCNNLSDFANKTEEKLKSSQSEMRAGELSTFNATGMDGARPQLKVNLIMTDFKSIYPTKMNKLTLI